MTQPLTRTVFCFIRKLLDLQQSLNLRQDDVSISDWVRNQWRIIHGDIRNRLARPRQGFSTRIAVAIVTRFIHISRITAVRKGHLRPAAVGISPATRSHEEYNRSPRVSRPGSAMRSATGAPRPCSQSSTDPAACMEELTSPACHETVNLQPALFLLAAPLVSRLWNHESKRRWTVSPVPQAPGTL